jgi:hypothetical protein
MLGEKVHSEISHHKIFFNSVLFRLSYIEMYFSAHGLKIMSVRAVSKSVKPSFIPV